MTVRDYDQLKWLVDAELKRGRIGLKPTFFQDALDRRADIGRAEGNYSERMKAAARYGAVFKRWEHMLIVHITAIALRGCELSRTNVRHWQKRVFGKSLASSDLVQYATSTRGAEVKIPALASDNPSSLEAKHVFERFRHLLRKRMAES